MMDQNETISVRPNRRPVWTRLLDIILRTAHVLVISVLFGGAVLKFPPAGLVHWQYLALASGGALILSELLHGRHWPYQGRGVMVFIHVGLFSLVGLRPDLALPCLLAALVVGMLGSHMPKRLRYWSFVHRQVKD
jgi:hypothetical protein